MQTPELALLISSGALAVSLVNFSVAYAAFRRTHIGRLRIEVGYAVERRQVRVSFVNTGSRPITVEEAQLGYGTAPSTMASFLNVLEYLPATSAFAIGEHRFAEIPEDDLRSRARGNKVKQGRYRRLWLRAKVAGGGYIDELVHVDSRIVSPDVPAQAVPYMAADAVLGFPLLEPVVNPMPSFK